MEPSRHDLEGKDEQALNIKMWRRKWVARMKATHPKKIDAEKTKLYSDGQIFPRGGRLRVADAQA